MLEHFFFPANYDLAILLTRLILGGFFVLARFRWVYDPSRSETFANAMGGEPIRDGGGTGRRWFNDYRVGHLQWKLCACGFGYHKALAACVACIEIFGGLAVLVGLLTPLAAVGLFAVTLGATACTAYEKTMKQHPVDRIDCACCYLWNVEPHLLVAAAVLAATGGGAYSVDALLWRMM